MRESCVFLVAISRRGVDLCIFLRADRRARKPPNCGRPRADSNAIYVTCAPGLGTRAYLRAFLAIRAIRRTVAICMHFYVLRVGFGGSVGRFVCIFTCDTRESRNVCFPLLFGDPPFLRALWGALGGVLSGQFVCIFTCKACCSTKSRFACGFFLPALLRPSLHAACWMYRISRGLARLGVGIHAFFACTFSRRLCVVRRRAS